MITAQQLSQATNCPLPRAVIWAPLISDVMDSNNIIGTQRMAAFIAQVAHESQRFSVVEENLNYSAQALVLFFPRYYTAISAVSHARQPELIANHVYANRMGNGDEASGDGWQYRGRGLIQITGRENYESCGQSLGIDLVNIPNALLEPVYAARSAGWFWSTRNLNALADDGDVTAVTRRINGGTNGLAERQALYDATLKVLESA